jgi:hypothetical protein
MVLGRGFIRGCAALLALSVCSGEPLTGATAAQASTPILSWQNVKRLQVLCLVATDRMGERETLERRLCDQVRSLAAAGAPVPVDGLVLGDPKLIDPANVTLLVHGNVQQVGGARLLTMSVRSYRTGGAHNDTIFGAPPRAIALGDGPEANAALAEALRATLSETVPWLATPAGPRPITR